MPSYEEPVETAKDVIKRNIIPFYTPGGEIMKQFFANSNSSDPTDAYRKISQTLIIPKSKCELNINKYTNETGKKLCDLGWPEYKDMISNVTSTGKYALLMGNIEESSAFSYVVTDGNKKKEENWKKNWYRSTKPISLDYPYTVHLSNKKWPLKKVM